LLENKYYNFNGLNLSIETLDGLIKHNGPVKDEKKLNNILGKNFFKKKINFSDSPSMEAQIASISDDIAYNSHDIEDGLKAELFSLKDISEIPVLKRIIQKNKVKIPKFSQELVIRQIIREIINEMVKDVILNTKKNLKKKKIRNIKDIYKSPYPLVCFSKQMRLFDREVKSFLRENMYYHKNVIHKTNQGKKIIKRLFFVIKKNPKKFIDFYSLKKIHIDRIVCDFIAGMTDRYAINLYDQIK